MNKELKLFNNKAIVIDENKKEKELIKIGEDFAKIDINFAKEDRNGNIKINIENKKNILPYREKFVL